MFKYKKTLLAAFIMTVPVLTLEVFAQPSFLDSKSNTKKANQAATVKVLTPEEFSSSVKTAGQENQSQLQQKASEMATKLLPPPPKPTPAQTMPAAPSAASSTKPSAPIEAAPAETVTPPPVVAEQPAPPVTEPAAEVPAPAATQSHSSSPSSQPYTGFGNSGNSSQGSAPAQQSGSGGGWNIKY